MKFILDTNDGMLFEYLIQDYPCLKKIQDKQKWQLWSRG